VVERLVQIGNEPPAERSGSALMGVIVSNDFVICG
jgi:hypothetical protein